MAPLLILMIMEYHIDNLQTIQYVKNQYLFKYMCYYFNTAPSSTLLYTPQGYSNGILKQLSAAGLTHLRA